MSPLGIALGVPWFDGIFGTPTPVAYSLQFDGNNDYISVPNVASLRVTGNQSWSIWCKLEDVTANQSLFGIRESSTTKYKIYCFKRASNDATVAYRNQIQVTISADGGFTNQKSYISVGLTTSSWGLLTATFTADTLKLYWNAVELTTGAGTLTKITDGTVNSIYNNTTEPLLIGALNATPSFFAKGYLDYLIFCNKTLSSTEVSEIYSAKPNLLPVASGFSFSANIVSLWKIGEDPDVYNGTGGILDSVGTNHGTMNGFDVGGSFSTDVAKDSLSAYLELSGITDPTIISAYTDFYNGLIADGLWDKIHDFAPLMGGTATSHSIWGKNPYRAPITWVGSPTHNANGVKGNGSNQYGNLNWNPVTEGADSSNFGLAVYRSGVESGAGSAYSMGISGTAIGYLLTGGKDGGLLASNNEITPPTTPSPNKDSGFHIVYLTNSRSAKYRRNKTLLGATTQTGSFNNLSLFGLCINASGSPAAYANVGVHKFFGITKGLTNTEADLLADRVLTLQTALGRA